MAVLTSIQVNAVVYVLDKHKPLYWMCVSITYYIVFLYIYIYSSNISNIRLNMLIKQQKKNMRITH